ncbi:MAG: alpha-L-fucosidase [Clostridia bacterium]|nr:alpha-L-fucosidase [Clostridia bacterium]
MNNRVDDIKISLKNANDTFEGTEVTRENRVEDKAAQRHWFREAQFGMMIHWGLYSLLAGEYRGQKSTRTAEWIQSNFRIPNAEYERLAEAFNPIYFDADEWVSLASEAGMKYIVMTAKHHEGFAMFKSECDSYNIVDATPFGRDVIGELAEACRKQNMPFGLYYSQELDWHEPHGGGYFSKRLAVGGLHWTNNWDFPDDAAKNFDICFRKKTLPQVREILTKYGELCLVWFDTPKQITPEQSDELYRLVKELQSKALINSRIGNGRGDYRSTGDNGTDETPADDELMECPATMNDSWGFRYYDNDWRSADEILALRARLNARGVNLLLNVGPDHLGRIPSSSADILREVGKRS